MNFASEQLSNGLTVHRAHMPGSKVVSAAIAFPAGSRHELTEEAGLAHFSEHAALKGSRSYPTHRDINCRAEDLGIRLNANTNQDGVYYHFTARAEMATAALELLCDIVATPVLDREELRRERGIIIEEIRGFADDLDYVAYLALQEALYGQHPLARSVGGTELSVSSFTDTQVRAFRARHYGAVDATAVFAGATKNMQAQMNELLEKLPSGEHAGRALAAPPFAARVQVRERDTNQTHLRLSFKPQVNTCDPKQMWAFRLYATILGGSTSSRLFEELREQQSLCYFVQAFSAGGADRPLLRVNMGLNPQRCQEAFTRICEIVTELADEGPTPAEVERARSYLLGRLAIAYEDAAEVVEDVVTDVLSWEQTPAPHRELQLLRQVSFEEVQQVAEGVDARPAVGCAGPNQAQDFIL
jgi:predicted Zn-dependent peptidase